MIRLQPRGARSTARKPFHPEDVSGLYKAVYRYQRVDIDE